MKTSVVLRDTYLDDLKRFAQVSGRFRTPDDEVCYLTSELGIPRITLDPLFRRFVSHWNDGPTLDAAYFALEALQLINPDFRLSEGSRMVLQRLLRSCFLEAEGGFWPTPFGRTASLYGTICALGIIKSFDGYGCGERPGNDVAACDEYYSSFIDVNLATRMKTLIKQRASANLGACFDSAQWPVPCVISTSVASSLLWNAGYRSETLLEILPEERLTDFLARSVYTHRGAPVSWQAFRPHPDQDRPGLSVTYHALKLAGRLNLELPIERQKIRAFVQLCWTGQGFSSTIGESPSLLSTYYALACLQDENLCGPDDGFVREIESDVVELVEACRERFVYSISPSFLPNAAATRYAIQILQDRLDRREMVNREMSTAAVLREFWQHGEGFIAYPIQVVMRTSRVYGGYALLRALVAGFAIALSPLWLLKSILITAWAHRRV